VAFIIECFVQNGFVTVVLKTNDEADPAAGTSLFNLSRPYAARVQRFVSFGGSLEVSMSTKRKSVRRFRTHAEAEQRLSQVEKKLEQERDRVELCRQRMLMLAKLAADGPCFFNHLHVAEAKALRNDLLYQAGLRPNGQPTAANMIEPN